MRTATRRRSTMAVAASLIAHIAVFAVLWMQRPVLVIPEEQAGPPEPVIPVLLMPRTPPVGAAHGAPAQIRLHQRIRRLEDRDLPVAPLVLPPAPSPPLPAPGPVTVRAPSESAEPQQANVQGALRGLLGCANPNLASLSLAQRAKCEERLAAGAKDQPFLGLGVNADKQRLLDIAGARREAEYKYKRSPPIFAPGVAGADDPGKPLPFDLRPLRRLPP